jgi:hypothetical protein
MATLVCEASVHVLTIDQLHELATPEAVAEIVRRLNIKQQKKKKEAEERYQREARIAAGIIIEYLKNRGETILFAQTNLVAGSKTVVLFELCTSNEPSDVLESFQKLALDDVFCADHLVLCVAGPTVNASTIDHIKDAMPASRPHHTRALAVNTTFSIWFG